MVLVILLLIFRLTFFSPFLHSLYFILSFLFILVFVYNRMTSGLLVIMLLTLLFIISSFNKKYAIVYLCVRE